jgi:hypothetical protein
MSPLNHDFVNLRLRAGAPPRDGREYLSLSLDVRVTPLDVFLSGAIAVTIVWLTTRRNRTGAEPVGETGGEGLRPPIADTRAAIGPGARRWR